MKGISQIMAGAAIVAALSLVALPALSQTTAPTPFHKAAPGPIIGAGLPALAIGFGAYWLIWRRRKAQ